MLPVATLPNKERFALPEILLNKSAEIFICNFSSFLLYVPLRRNQMSFRLHQRMPAVHHHQLSAVCDAD